MGAFSAVSTSSSHFVAVFPAAAAASCQPQDEPSTRIKQDAKKGNPPVLLLTV
jgi:hypothetical protein